MNNSVPNIQKCCEGKKKEKENEVHVLEKAGGCWKMGIGKD